MKIRAVRRLKLPESLERVLSSINLIGNLFSRVRYIARRLVRWQCGTMILRCASRAGSKPSAASARSRAIERYPGRLRSAILMTQQPSVVVKLIVAAARPKLQSNATQNQQ